MRIIIKTGNDTTGVKYHISGFQTPYDTYFDFDGLTTSATHLLYQLKQGGYMESETRTLDEAIDLNRGAPTVAILMDGKWYRAKPWVREDVQPMLFLNKAEVLEYLDFLGYEPTYIEFKEMEPGDIFFAEYDAGFAIITHPYTPSIVDGPDYCWYQLIFEKAPNDDLYLFDREKPTSKGFAKRFTNLGTGSGAQGWRKIN